MTGSGTMFFFMIQSMSEEGNMMQKITRTLKKIVTNMAPKSASMEANTACPCMNFQPKEPQTVKKLRKF